MSLISHNFVVFSVIDIELSYIDHVLHTILGNQYKKMTAFKDFIWLFLFMGLGRVVDVALTSKAEGCGFDPQLEARFLPQHVDPPIN